MSEGVRMTSEEAKKFYGRRRFDRRFSDLNKLPEKIKQHPDYDVYQGSLREEYASILESRHSIEVRNAFEKVCHIAEAVKAAGGQVLLVGGCVRDEILGVSSKDFDIEVYGLEPEILEEILKKFGDTKDVGRAFGILKITDDSGFDIDVSLPRTDSKINEGHRGFEVKVDPAMSIKEAAKRRDFTFNALSKNPLTGEIFDAWGGVRDLETRTLRVTDPVRFRDDPLRLLRAAQFVGRFGLAVESETQKLLQDMVPNLKEISVDRIRDEWEKMLLRSVKPSMSLTLLNTIGLVDAYYPELAALRGSQQEFAWHPEGDVWVHTLLVVDAANNLVKNRKLPVETARIIMLTALCHDLGKPGTTSIYNGRIISHGHDSFGVEPTRSFLERIGTRKRDIEKVGKLVKDHIWPTVMFINETDEENRRGKATPGAFRRLAKRLDPATVEDLSYIAEVDCLGVGPFFDPDAPGQLLLKTTGAYGLEAARWIRQKAKELDVYQAKPRPIIMGRDLMELGFKPSTKKGETFGVLIELADESRDALGMERDDILGLLKGCKGDIANAIKILREKINQTINPFK